MFKQDQLRYDYGALEPHLDRLTMETHYEKHHGAYTKNLNKALAALPSLHGKSIEEILRNLEAIADPALRTTVRNNGGGFYNHNLYFGILGPQGRPKPGGVLAKRVERDFGSLEGLKEELNKAALSVFGSGWAWLSTDSTGRLLVSSTPNQDNPLLLGENNLVPVLGIDVWEHAYYLKYKNLRGAYLQAFFEVLDWEAVALRYQAAL